MIYNKVCFSSHPSTDFKQQKDTNGHFLEYLTKRGCGALYSLFPLPHEVKRVKLKKLASTHVCTNLLLISMMDIDFKNRKNRKERMKENLITVFAEINALGA